MSEAAALARRRRIAISSGVATALFAILNAFDPARYKCCDFVLPYGLPFTYMEEGGYISVRRIHWGGGLADFVAVVITAVSVSYVWNWMSRRVAADQAANL